MGNEQLLRGKGPGCGGPGAGEPRLFLSLPEGHCVETDMSCGSGID